MRGIERIIETLGEATNHIVPTIKSIAMKQFFSHSLSFACIFILAVSFASCGSKEKKEYPNPPLGEFARAGFWVDMSKTNLYDEKVFCKHWILKSVTHETYIDGSLEMSEDLTGTIGAPELYFYEDHKFKRDKSPTQGKWLYSHNYLIWEYLRNYIAWEVLKVNDNELKIREEGFDLGEPVRPYHKDPRGRHYFTIYDYRAE